ncbi:VRR-NUC domain-containing protein [Psychrobacter pygoscelis]|uniref:VRR-NUC domain-containing protein n=1 Tax=Psychrobacter pygoscelis TaxID=2488563 RepID=UPI00103F5D08|nr:VRR-NUC domain-containing protein [Psychrobacter pygoscelis]
METEKDIENYLVAEARKIGALVRKCQWIGHNHCPDRIIMTPAITVWVEAKAPGKNPRPGQRREHDRMRRAGQTVFNIDSRGAVDWLINEIKEANSG